MTATVDKVDDLRDERLWQALEYAPDQNAAPDWRLRKAILKKAGDAVGAVDPYEAEAALELAARPWWRGGGASDGKRSRLPWVAVFAALLVGTLVTMLWRRDPVIAPQRDVGPKVAVPAPQAPPVPGLAEAVPPSNQVASRTSSSSPSAPPSAAPSAPSSVPSSASLPSTALPEPPPLPVAAPNPPVASAAPTPSVKSQQKTPSPTTPAPSVPKREGAETTAKPVPPTVPTVPTVPAVPAVPPQASTEVARVVPTPAPSPSVRTEATEPPTFSALSRWTRMTIARRGGETRTVQREEARDLNALLGSAAISAVGSQPMRAAAEYRVTMERNGEVLAVFEVAPTQVRWREGKTPPATGVPSAPALAALREALRETVHPSPMAPSTFAPPRNP